MIYNMDECYLEALRARDPAAEEHLVCTLSRHLKTSLRKRFRSTEIVEDAMQETLLRVLVYFRSGKTLRAASNLQSFAKAVSLYVSFEMLRDKAYRNTTTDNGPESVDQLPNPEAHVISDQQKQLVMRALCNVDGKDAYLLRRIYLEDADKDQVCRELNVSRGYLRVLLHRAKLRFKSAVQVMEQHTFRASAGTPPARAELHAPLQWKAS